MTRGGGGGAGGAGGGANAVDVSYVRDGGGDEGGGGGDTHGIELCGWDADAAGAAYAAMEEARAAAVRVGGDPAAVRQFAAWAPTAIS